MTDSNTWGERSSSSTAAATTTTEQPARANVIALASGRDGVGKTSLCVNLGIALARQGRRVCLLDTEIDTNHGDSPQALSPKPLLKDLLQDRSIDELLTTGPGGMTLVSATTGMGEFIHLDPEQQQRLLGALKRLEQRFDYLLVDTPGGSHETLVQLLLAASYTVLTITPDPSSLSDAFSLLKRLKRCYFSHPLYVIVNRVSSLHQAHDTFRQLKQSAARSLQLEIRYLGYALSDGELTRLSPAQQPILLQRPRAMFSLCLSAVSNRLVQLLDRDPLPEHSLSDFFQKLSLPRQQKAQKAPQPVPITKTATNEQTTLETRATPNPNTTSKTEDEHAALLAATYYAHLLGSKETING